VIEELNSKERIVNSIINAPKSDSGTQSESNNLAGLARIVSNEVTPKETGILRSSNQNPKKTKTVNFTANV